MTKALVMIEDTPMFMGWAGGGVHYTKTNKVTAKWLISCGPILIRNHPMVIYRAKGGEEAVPIGDTLQLHP